ncbi:MAG: Holliday junction branch migration DNA helicase RuvB [Bacteriovoracaceae bacterium]|nr:Holliday junction branch migration DNA helicase RuvB [Bacteriovoracaceae bacterium]
MQKITRLSEGSLPAGDGEEFHHDARLRPQNFSEYIGQKRTVNNIELMVASAIKRKSAMDHVLLSGPPGLGKTSLAMLIAQVVGSQLHVISGPALEKKGDLAAILTNIAPRDVLFIDEIHRLHISIEEILYSAMEDFRLDIVMGQGVSARTMQINLVPFTLIGATTRAGLLSNPLRDRFTAHLTFDYYGTGELAQIIGNNVKKIGLELKDEAREMIALRARGTPRIANRILRRVRDYSLVHNRFPVTVSDVEESLKLLDIDELGLDTMDRKILKVMQDYYAGGPVGIEALCATLGEDRHTVEDVYEPYLLKEGFLLRTPRGRVLSDKAKNHLGQN